MKRKRYSVEQIIGKLREVEVRILRRKNIRHLGRELGITDQGY